MWCLACSHSGYLLKFEVYLGKSEEVRNKNPTYFNIVDKMTRHLHNKNHHVYYDNLFTSVELAKYLLLQGTYSCGTMRSRKYTPDIVRKPSKTWPRGTIHMFQDTTERNLTTCVWMDSKPVRFLSTLAQPKLFVSTPRRVKSRYVNLDLPHCASKYGKSMNGVDHFDGLRKAYHVGRNSKKSWKYILWFLLDSALVNAWILHKECNTRRNLKKTYDHFDFRMEVATQLVNFYTSRKHGQCKRAFVQQQDVEEHENVHMRAKRPKRCFSHKDYKPDGKSVYSTVYGCQKCGVHLCKKCHTKFHNAQN